MAWRWRILWLVCLALSGCLSQRTGLLVADGSLASDLSEPAEPRLARLQGQDADPGFYQVAQATPPPPPPMNSPMIPPTSPPTTPPVVSPGAGPPSTSSPTAHRIHVRAWVNSQPIFENEIINLIARGLMELQGAPEPQRSEKIAQLREKALEHLIEEELLYQDAVNKLEKNNPKALEKLREAGRQEFEKKIRKVQEELKVNGDEFKSMLRKQGQTLDAWQKREEHRFIAEEYMRSRIMSQIIRIVNHALIREYYDQHRNEFQKLDSVKWQDVFIAVGQKHPTVAHARQFAEALVARCKAGEDFAKLLEFDDGDSKIRGGWGQGERRGEIRPVQVEEILFRMTEGQIGPLVEMDTGIHIVRLVKREQAGQLPFDEKLQTMIRNKLRSELAQREQQRVMSELKSRAIIEIIRDGQ